MTSKEIKRSLKSAWQSSHFFSSVISHSHNLPLPLADSSKALLFAKTHLKRPWKQRNLTTMKRKIKKEIYGKNTADSTFIQIIQTTNNITLWSYSLKCSTPSTQPTLTVNIQIIVNEKRTKSLYYFSSKPRVARLIDFFCWGEAIKKKVNYFLGGGKKEWKPKGELSWHLDTYNWRTPNHYV